MKRLLFLQLNELNFDDIAAYAAQGKLPHFAELFARHGYVQTLSESDHENVNPWIQWPTVHTGLDYAEHGVFRLGDIVHTTYPHVYEVLERHGVSVAALSPFNARNNTRHARFFVPDPWTKTTFTGSKDLRYLYDALVQITDDYAKGTVVLKAMMNLLRGALPNLRPSSLLPLLHATIEYGLHKRKWWRAIVCDRVLTDTFMRHWRIDQPDFATLFLNGGAHLQHHYLFSSPVYSGLRRNPEWHVPADADPLLDILQCYDRIVGELVALTKHDRLIIATALHQAAHERETYYYRLDNHVALLDAIGIDYVETYRLMTEDFVIRFKDSDSASQAETILAAVQTLDTPPLFYVETGDSPIRTSATAAPIFHIENRGDSLYLQLRPSAGAMVANMKIRSGDIVIDHFEQRVSLAQYKNTHHVGIGYYVDTRYQRGELPASFPLREIFDVILGHFKIDSGRVSTQSWQ